MPSLGLVALRSGDSQEDAQPMVDAIGKLIINCGLLETGEFNPQVHHWLVLASVLEPIA